MKSILILTLCASLNAGAGDEVSDTLVASCITAFSRAEASTPVAFSSTGHEELRSSQPSASLPQVLSLQPSVVSVSECGTGVGYTSMSIRGISSYHTNVSVNGINLGDSESQQLFWVNIPAMGNMLSSIQIQRGLGTVSCGPGAFGASINMLTGLPSFMHDAALTGSGVVYAGNAAGSYGAFGTWTISGRGGFSSPLSMDAGSFVYAEAMVNYSHSDGYVYDAPADAGSAFLNVGWEGFRDRVQLVFIQGVQKSAITWNGISLEDFALDPRVNHYAGDSDNFNQTHVQLLWKHDFSNALSWNNVADYTHGAGWYDILNKSAGVREYSREENNFGAWLSSLTWRREKLSLTGTAYLSGYGGSYWDALPEDHSAKCEADISARASFAPGAGVSFFTDIQYRSVFYRHHSVENRWNFCNPRLGVNWSSQNGHRVYASAALGHREPARADFESNPQVGRERMLDFETGYGYSSEIFHAEFNLYDMEYYDMLMETGSLNSQGYAIKDNVDRAGRHGIELSMAGRAFKWLELEGNCSYSINKVKPWTKPDGERAGESPIPLSPSWIAGAKFQFTPFKGFCAALTAKYVGKQYLCASYSSLAEIPSYLLMNMALSQRFEIKGRYALKLSFWADNLLNRKYYAYAFNAGTVREPLPYVYPAAPFSWTARLEFEF